jgi:hypothetical protein
MEVLPFGPPLLFIYMKVLLAKAKHMGKQKCGASGNILGRSLGTWGTI